MVTLSRKPYLAKTNVYLVGFWDLCIFVLVQIYYTFLSQTQCIHFTGGFISGQHNDSSTESCAGLVSRLIENFSKSICLYCENFTNPLGFQQNFPLVFSMELIFFSTKVHSSIFFLVKSLSSYLRDFLISYLCYNLSLFRTFMSTPTGDPSPSLSLAHDYHVMDTLFNDQVAVTREALRMFQAVIPLKETTTVKVVLEELVNIAVSHLFPIFRGYSIFMEAPFRLVFTTSPLSMYRLPSCIVSSLLQFFWPLTTTSRKTPTSSTHTTIHSSCAWSLS